MDHDDDESSESRPITLPHALDLLAAGWEVPAKLRQEEALNERIPDLLAAIHPIAQGLEQLRVDWRKLFLQDRRLRELIPTYELWLKRMRVAEVNTVSKMRFTIHTSPFLGEAKAVHEFFRIMSREKDWLILELRDGKATFTAGKAGLSIPAKFEAGGTRLISPGFLILLRSVVREDEWLECFVSHRHYRVGNAKFEAYTDGIGDCLRHEEDD